MAEPLLRPLVKSWVSKLHLAHTHKTNSFGRDAEEAEKFFDGPHDFMYGDKYPTASGMVIGDDEAAPSPTFRMSVNKVAEMVQIFGPVLYHRNPYRQVTTRALPDIPAELMQGYPEAFMQQLAQSEFQMQSDKETRAKLLESYLNYTPNELNLQWNSRQCIDEAIIKGMGVLWHEVIQPHGSPYRMVGSFYDSVDNLLVDPDMESIFHAKWIARRRVMPKWEVERRFGMKRGTIRGNLESSAMQAESGGANYDYFRQSGDTNDLTTYWEVYSRMGMGHHLRSELSRAMEVNKELLDSFGDHVYLAFCEEHPHFLNIPEEVLEKGDMEEVFRRVQWPTPFWADPAHPWPFSELSFHERPRRVWPMSHVKPALGELKFINWCMSFIADKVKNTSRDFIGVLKSAGEDIKSSVLSGRDLTLLEIEDTNRRIDEVVQFLQHPPFNKDVLVVLAEQYANFDKRVGLDELMYGTSKRQLRSAAEAQVKSDKLEIRPHDMAQKVEKMLTVCARKEAICARWHLTKDDVAPVLGVFRAMLWEQYVQNNDLPTITHELDYRIEAGTVRKPNRERDMENANEAIRVWGPVLQAYAQMTLDFDPLNALITAWAKAYDVESENLLLKPPPPPQPDETAMQEAQMELEMRQQEHEQKLGHSQETHRQKLQAAMDQDMLKVLRARAGLVESDEVHEQKLGHSQETHSQDLTQDQQKHLQEMLQAREEGQLDMYLKRRLAEAKPSGNGGPKE